MKIGQTSCFNRMGIQQCLCTHTKKIKRVKDEFPLNLEVLQNALGVIVHSRYSKHLARQWYGEDASDTWNTIPLLIKHVSTFNKLTNRPSLNLKEDDFVVCSFGLRSSHQA